MLLHHGTTRKRAEAMINTGPDANYREPNGGPADGFSAARPEGPFDLGSPEDYARKKAKIFPDEGGPAILVFELPDDLAETMVGRVGELVPGKALHAGSEIRFEPGGGLEQLQAVWPDLKKSVTLL